MRLRCWAVVIGVIWKNWESRDVVFAAQKRARERRYDLPATTELRGTEHVDRDNVFLPMRAPVVILHVERRLDHVHICAEYAAGD